MADEQTKNDAMMLRRAATASRNFKRQAVGQTSWFDWVPQYLDGLADRLDPPYSDTPVENPDPSSSDERSAS